MKLFSLVSLATDKTCHVPFVLLYLLICFELSVSNFPAS